MRKVPRLPCRTGILVLALATASGACSRWRLASSPTPQVIAAERPELVRITTGDGTRLQLRHPTVRLDSIRGTTSVPTCTVQEAFLAESADQCPTRDVVVTLHGSEMVELELREASLARTIALAGGLAVAAVQVIRVSVKAFGS